MNNVLHSGLLLRLRSALLFFSDFEQTLQAQTTIKTCNEIERMVMLSAAAELAGISLAPLSLTLRLLPYLMPKVYQWRRLAQGENDLSAEIITGC